MTIYLKGLLTEKLSKSEITTEKRDFGGQESLKQEGEKHSKSNYSVSLKRMLLWREINSRETNIFTKIILLRETALERAKKIFFPVHHL